MASLFPGLLIAFSMAASAATVPASFETIAKQADAARVQDRIPEAIRLYREGTGLRPSWADGWWYLGSLLYDQDRFTDASAAFQHLLSSSSHRGPAYAFLGLCEYETGNYDDALTQFRAWAAAGWSGTPELRNVAVFHFALLLTRDGRFVESLYLLATEAKLGGDLPELAEAMGLASLRMRNLPEDYAPEQRERVWLAGTAAVYESRSPRDFARANEFADRLETRYRGQPEVHYFRATLDEFESNRDEAEREYRAELKISPNHAQALTALAAIDLQKADRDEAGLLARRAIAADGDYAEAHHMLGRVLIDSGDLQSGLVELETAKRLAPGNPLVHSHLAMAYSKLGRKQEAKAETETFLALKSKEYATAPVEDDSGARTARKKN